MKTYRTKTGLTQRLQAFTTLQRAILADEGTGFCLACGKSQTYVEPDAKRYRCVSCDQPKVYGAEQLLLMGLHY